MTQLLWLATAWLGGTAVILGSLMILGSLLVWFVPFPPVKPNPEQPLLGKDWQGRLQVLGFSVTIALLGISLLVLFPFPGE